MSVYQVIIDVSPTEDVSAASACPTRPHSSVGQFPETSQPSDFVGAFAINDAAEKSLRCWHLVARSYKTLSGVISRLSAFRDNAVLETRIALLALVEPKATCPESRLERSRWRGGHCLDVQARAAVAAIG